MTAPGPDASDADEAWDADIEERVRFGICWKKPMGIAEFGDVNIALTERRMIEAADEIGRLRRELEDLRAQPQPAAGVCVPESVIARIQGALDEAEEFAADIGGDDLCETVYETREALNAALQAREAGR